MKRTVTIGLIIVLGIFGVFLFKNSKNKPQSVQSETKQMINGDQSVKENEDKMILFYGITCPHCKVVEKYIADNQIDSNLEIEQKEVYKNQENANLLIQKGQECELGENIGAVPLLWTGSECVIGDQPIIDFLNKKIQENQ